MDEMDKLQGSIGIVGTGTMGGQLALNLTERGCKVVVFDKQHKQLHELQGAGIKSVSCLAELVAILPIPRLVLLMVPAGDAVDVVLDELMVLLDKGDVVVDGGNSYFLDTKRRGGVADKKSIFYYGAGISGGKEGARNGPAVMLGGPQEGLPLVMPILSGMAAKKGERRGFVYCGDDGVGHFVKMVHNVVEYAIMQLQAELYLIMRDLQALAGDEIAKSFTALNRGSLRSSLMNMNVAILNYRDAKDGLLLDHILDRAKQSGTGRWAANTALELGVPAPTLLSAVDARSISMQGDLRKSLQNLYSNKDKQAPTKANLDNRDYETALYAGIICAFAEGFSLLKAGKDHYNWASNLSNTAICDVWNCGSILEGEILDIIRGVWERSNGDGSILADDEIAKSLSRGESSWRKVVSAAIAAAIPVPALTASLGYFDGIRKARCGANLLQAQRDCFGAHTYQRIDRDGQFHTEWEEK
ncbi:MAG: NADP-dependent phosphogluconate dehydrogenase [Magnetococcales bacterium]|nr:NADP-dependent phosphogluconate dehydrogenase [Magnetococcales bacterium]